MDWQQWRLKPPFLPRDLSLDHHTAVWLKTRSRLIRTGEKWPRRRCSAFNMGPVLELVLACLLWDRHQLPYSHCVKEGVAVDLKPALLSSTASQGRVWKPTNTGLETGLYFRMKNPVRLSSQLRGTRGGFYLNIHLPVFFNLLLSSQSPFLSETFTVISAKV